MKEFKDNATKPIIAFDFDGTLTDSNIFPAIGDVRKYAKEVVNLLYDLGAIILIWTCRDTGHIVVQDELGSKMDYVDDIKTAVDWLNQNGFKFHDINTCIKYAPFHYEARKIYAHMYVDDKGFGWDNEDPQIMLKVLAEALVKVMKLSPHQVASVMNKIRRGEDIKADDYI